MSVELQPFVPGEKVGKPSEEEVEEVRTYCKRSPTGTITDK